MSENMDLWQRVCRTDPAAVKAITGKQYQGNSPKPYWLIEQATKTFGPVGIGWGCDVKSERFERLSETDVLHVAVVSVWFMLDGKRSHTFDQMGGTKAAYKTAKGSLMVDEDAGKKSVTDGMVKCLSMIGFAGDIFSGRWDDSKYVAEMRKEFAKEDDGDPALMQQLKASSEAVQAFKGERGGVMGTVLPAVEAELTSEVKRALMRLAPKVIAGLKDSPAKAQELVAEQGLNDDEYLYLWSMLPSNVRSALKKEPAHV